MSRSKCPQVVLLQHGCCCTFIVLCLMMLLISSSNIYIYIYTHTPSHSLGYAMLTTPMCPHLFKVAGQKRLLQFCKLSSCCMIPLGSLMVGWCISMYIYIYTHCKSNTAQGGGGSYKDRKPTGEVSCCDAWMAKPTDGRKGG